jgi:hypothetical protein
MDCVLWLKSWRPFVVETQGRIMRDREILLCSAFVPVNLREVHMPIYECCITGGKVPAFSGRFVPGKTVSLSRCFGVDRRGASIGRQAQPGIWRAGSGGAARRAAFYRIFATVRRPNRSLKGIETLLTPILGVAILPGKFFLNKPGRKPIEQKNNDINRSAELWISGKLACRSD